MKQGLSYTLSGCALQLGILGVPSSSAKRVGHSIPATAIRFRDKT
jgi:hypothetical protein